MSNIRRYVEAFDKRTELLSYEIEFDMQPTLCQLQAIFGEHEKDPMYDGYLIDERIASQLVKFVCHEFRFRQFDYFLACASC
jgi:hypothetical protein